MRQNFSNGFPGWKFDGQVTSMLRKEQEEEARLAEKLQEQKYQPKTQRFWGLDDVVPLFTWVEQTFFRSSLPPQKKNDPSESSRFPLRLLVRCDVAVFSSIWNA